MNTTATREQRAHANDAVLDSPVFLKACEIAGITPSRRQASKFNNGYGLAHAHRHDAARQLAKSTRAQQAVAS